MPFAFQNRIEGEVGLYYCLSHMRVETLEEFETHQPIAQKKDRPIYDRHPSWSANCHKCGATFHRASDLREHLYEVHAY